MKYLMATSMGNDSIALAQYMQENHKGEFAAIYNDTGWARSDWPNRVKEFSDWCFNNGVQFFITKSEGLESLVRRKKGWPMPASKMQFCTSELKEKPTLELLGKIDPDGDLIIVTGRRREESQNRANLSSWQYDSIKHGGRDVFNPLVSYNENQRNHLISDFGWSVLPHQSMECYPCVCANKSDMKQMAHDEARISQIEAIEISMGHTRNEKPRTMFRPYRAGGGVGIRQVVEWGIGPRGHKANHYPEAYKFKGTATESDSDSDVAYEESTKAGREFARQCDGGYCGS
jgi:3'-phosphoadenosine 5'-phosphosulfate sulfotransferase (PAPS reductase)/FAD synthetase